MTPQLDEVAQEVAVIRPRMGPGDLLIAGGPHATADPQGTLALGFHAVVAGEAETALPELLEHWSRGGDPRDVRRIWRARGVACLDDSLPVSARLNWMAPLEISRGCPHGCGYCLTPRLYPAPVRHRSLASIDRYLTLARRMGRRLTRFIAPDAFAYRDPSARATTLESLEAVLGLCREHGIPQIHLGYFPSEVRPEHVTDELLGLVLTHCTNRKLVIGAQSGSDRVLGLMGRGHSARQAEAAILRVVASGLLAHVDMLFGIPGEEDEDRSRSLAFMERIIRRGRTRIHAHVYLPLPGTPLFPLPPAPLDGGFLGRIRELQECGVLDGDWEPQLTLQQRILAWRRQGVIRV
jgi:B12-binding domain/radical SAM domain protein